MSFTDDVRWLALVAALIYRPPAELAPRSPEDAVKEADRIIKSAEARLKER